jgi:hypothetical protein
LQHAAQEVGLIIKQKKKNKIHENTQRSIQRKQKKTHKEDTCFESVPNFPYLGSVINIKPITLARRSEVRVWATGLLGLFVRIPPGVWMSIS